MLSSGIPNTHSNLLSSAALLQLCTCTMKGQLPSMLLQHQCTDSSPDRPNWNF